MARKINITLNTKSINNAINELNEIKKGLETLNKDIMENSLDWIITRANMYFRERTRKHGSQSFTKIQEKWRYYPIGANTYHLTNDSGVSAYVEFGTGIMGNFSKRSDQANSVGWQYDVNNHGFEGWTYFNKEMGAYVHTIGYIGKSFLYDALWDFIYLGECQNVFNQTLNGTYQKQYSNTN